jgi:hypothetical protein
MPKKLTGISFVYTRKVKKAIFSIANIPPPRDGIQTNNNSVTFLTQLP